MAIKKSDLKDLSVKQLRDVIASAQELINEKLEHERQEAREKVQKMANELGYSSIEEMLGLPTRRGRGASGSRTPAKNKYQLPDGTKWTGKGRLPLAFRPVLVDDGINLGDNAAVKKGLQKYLIKE